jgi:hypothetical protein
MFFARLYEITETASPIAPENQALNIFSLPLVATARGDPSAGEGSAFDDQQRMQRCRKCSTGRIINFKNNNMRIVVTPRPMPRMRRVRAMGAGESVDRDRGDAIDVRRTRTPVNHSRRHRARAAPASSSRMRAISDSFRINPDS